MALPVLPIAVGPGTAEFTLTTDTLVWVHGPRAQGVMYLEIKGSDGIFSELLTLGDGARNGVLPAGDYKATRVSGNCGLQRAA